MGYILLAGGAEFNGHMAAPDLRAIELAGGLDARISIIPAAAAPDDNHQRAGQNGVTWFKQLGAADASAVPLLDRATADDPTVIEALMRSGVIYLLGGFPRHLEQSLAGTGLYLPFLLLALAFLMTEGLLGSPAKKWKDSDREIGFQPVENTGEMTGWKPIPRETEEIA